MDFFKNINIRLNNINEKLEHFSKHAQDFISRSNDTSVEQVEGIIKDLYIVGNYVRASIERTDSEESGIQMFNVSSGINPSMYTLPEVTIKTNINPWDINARVNYIGKKCKVILRHNVAIYAEIDLGENSLTIFPLSLLREIRLSDPNLDLFSTDSINRLKKEGYTDDEIEDLRKLTYREQTEGKIYTWNGEAIYCKDTSKPLDNEVILDETKIVQGLNNLGMKDRECHMPSVIFSGK